VPIVIHTYTRAQAIEDGVLIDVSEMAREAGFRWSVGVTAAVWAYVEPTRELEAQGQSTEGRLWDTVWMAALAARRASTGTTQMTFEAAYIQRPGRGPETVSLKMVAGPGDEGEPVMTIMLPGED